MINLVYGSDTSALRNFLRTKATKDVLIFTEYSFSDISTSELFTVYLAQDLFRNNALLAVDITGSKSLDFLKQIKDAPSDNLLYLIYYGDLPKALATQAKELAIKTQEFAQKDDSSIFAFTDALFNKKKDLAYKELHKLLAADVSEFEILTMIVYQLRNITFCKTKAKSFEGLHSFVQDKVRKQASLYTLADLEQIYDKCFYFDIALKTGGVPSDVAIPLLIEFVIG